jgi:L-asparaginase
LALRIALLSLGGTIASTRATRGGDGAVPDLGATELATTIASHLAGVTLDARDLRLLASSALSFDDVVAVATAARDELAAGAAGVVVTQGTDTLEETAFALDLLVDDERPIVVTGAMRTPLDAGADGPANILAAVRVAASDSARGLGCVVVMNDEIHAARYVRKSHTTSPAAFISPNCGPIGWVAEGRVRVTLRPAPLAARPGPPRGPVPPVAIVTMGLGDDGRLLDAVTSAGYAGLVVEAFGAGHVPASMVPRLAAVAADIPTVLASRTGAGALLTDTYGFPGSEGELLALGLVSAGALDARKARVLLSLLLAAGAGRDDVASAFAGLDDGRARRPD